MEGVLNMIIQWLLYAFFTPFIALFTGIAALIPDVPAPPLIYQQFLYFTSRLFGSGDEFLAFVGILITCFSARLSIAIFKFGMRVAFKLNL